MCIDITGLTSPRDAAAICRCAAAGEKMRTCRRDGVQVEVCQRTYQRAVSLRTSRALISSGVSVASWPARDLGEGRVQRGDGGRRGHALAPHWATGARTRRGERLAALAAAATRPADLLPVLNEDYAVRIARDWNVKASGVGYVTRFDVRREHLEQYDVQQVGGETILESWIPAERLDELNDNIVGTIELVHTFR